VSQNHAQNVYSTKSSNVVTSAARGRAQPVRTARVPVTKKKESSDETSATDTDSSDDTI